MKKLFLLLSVSLSGFAFSQVLGGVGVGTLAPKVTLDVSSTSNASGGVGPVTATDGVLVPRVNSLAVNGTQNGQLVFLVADAGGFTKGFHYWDNDATVWKSIVSRGLNFVNTATLPQNYVFTGTEDIVMFTSGGSLTLPTGTAWKNRTLYVKNATSPGVSITYTTVPLGGPTSVASNRAQTLYNDGANWIVISGL